MIHPELAGFPVVVELDVAWGDMDAYAHVNNVVYFRYFEAARIAYLDRIGWLASKDSTGLGPIMASTSARYRKPLTYPDHLLVGVRAGEVLHDRVIFEYRVISMKLNALAADGQVVVVSYDYQAAAKCPVPDAIRNAIREVQEE